jgi:16S rRNA (adenine1518-N6/adenine1519-N6)-dimethyltransferase
VSGYRAKKRLGQNFLKSSEVIDKIIESINLQPEDTIIEIGPGRGALTLPLAETGAKIIAVEYDRDLKGYLGKLLSKYSNVELIHGDFLEYVPTVIDYILVGNLPYNISSPVIEWATRNHNDIKDCYLMMQKEVADRLNSTPGSKDWSPLAIMTKIYFKVFSLFEIAPKHFKPQPKVTSSLVKLEPQEIKTNTDFRLFEKVVRYSFQQRRKTLMNNLVPTIIKTSDEANIIFDKLDLSSKSRAEQLTVEQFLNLTDLLMKHNILS